MSISTLGSLSIGLYPPIDDQNEALERIKLPSVQIISESSTRQTGHFTFENTENSFNSAQHNLPEKTPADKMALIYTSGTTGYPKPAIHTYGANLWAACLGLMFKYTLTLDLAH